MKNAASLLVAISWCVISMLSLSVAHAHTLRECSNASGSIWIRNEHIALFSTSVNNRSGEVNRSGQFSTQTYSIQWLAAPKIVSSSVSKDDCGYPVKEWHGIQSVILTPRHGSNSAKKKLYETMICHETTTNDSCRVE